MRGLFADQAHRHGIERKGPEQIAAHALLDLGEGSSGTVDPVDCESRVADELGQFGFEVEVANEARRARDDKEQILNEAAQSTQKIDGFFVAVGAGAITLCGVEELGVVRLAQRCAEEDQGVLTAGEVSSQVKVEGTANCAFSNACGQSAVGGL